MKRRLRASVDSGNAPRRVSKVTLLVVLGIVSVWLLLLGVRLFDLQVLQHEKFLAAGRRMWSGTDPIRSVRGDIRLKDGVLVARDVFSYEVGLDPSLIDSEERLVEAVRVVCDHLGQRAERRREALREALARRESGLRYVRLARHVEEDLAAQIYVALQGILPRSEWRAYLRRPTSSRQYPRGAFLGHVVGCTDPDGRGLEGVEHSMDGYLAHRPGKRQVLRGAVRGFRVQLPELREVAPIHGYDVVLTIESRAQRILEEELKKGIELQRAEAGLGIVLDCRNGAVRAMASYPDYDPANFHRYPPEEQARRRTNRPIENTYEPGSVLKAITLSSALSYQVARRDEIIWSGAQTHVFRHGRHGRPVSDTREHPPLTLEGVVVHSSNIGMSFIGLRLGRERLIEVLERFGFFEPTGIELPGEAPGGRTKREEWSELWTSVSVAFGYELRVTPLQLCSAFAALVNGGRLWRPRIVERALSGGEEVLSNPPDLVDRPISEAVSREVREILLGVVERGTGQRLKMDGFRFGGKSGTADMGRGYTKQDYLASFEAFAPYDDPEVVVLVMIEKPRAGTFYGSRVAGPVVATFLRRYFRVESLPRFARY